jgi:hypothetical protein
VLGATADVDALGETTDRLLSVTPTTKMRPVRRTIVWVDERDRPVAAAGRGRLSRPVSGGGQCGEPPDILLSDRDRAEAFYLFFTSTPPVHHLS